MNDTIPAIVSVGTLQKVLCNLLREGVPIRDIEAILETLADYGATVKDLDMLTEYVRQSLRRTITHRSPRPDSSRSSAWMPTSKIRSWRQSRRWIPVPIWRWNPS